MKLAYFFGIIFSLIGFYQFSNTYYITQTYQRINARITDVGEHRSREKTMYKPKFEYQIPGETTPRSGTSTLSSSSSYNMGDSIVILVDPTNSGNSFIESFSEIWLIPVVLLGIGLFLLNLAFFHHRSLRKQNTKLLQARKNKTPVEAEITEVRRTGVQVFGKDGYKIALKAMHPETRQLELFWTGTLWLTNHSFFPGKKVLVYLPFSEQEEAILEDEKYPKAS